MTSFEIHKKDDLTRAGSFKTKSGCFETPNFMPVGTKATVKGVPAHDLEGLGVQIMLVNTYHLWLRPGEQLVKELGGVHKFTAWNGPILSDSGGYQVFSLKAIRELTDEGVHFKSHLDGSAKFLSPEVAVQIQQDLDVDIAMVLDECPPASSSYDYCANSLQLTYNWAKRSYAARTKQNLALFGITQGGVFPNLRNEAAQQISELGFDGHAIGGLSVGEPIEQMYKVLSYHVEQLPENKIRYLMGVGTPRDIIEAVKYGVDLFDCVIPTRSGRFGRAFISGSEPYINIKNSKFANSNEALDLNCECKVCKHYSRGYINHLFKVSEMLGPILLTTHNIFFYMKFMEKIRQAIRQNSYNSLYNSEKGRWDSFKPE